MKELDLLLAAYLNDCYELVSDEEKAAFCELLTLPDPQLARYLLQQQLPESESYSRVVNRILGRTAP